MNYRELEDGLAVRAKILGGGGCSPLDPSKSTLIGPVLCS